jgi:hypothetical protein
MLKGARAEDAVCRPGMPAIDAVGYRVVHPGPLLDRHQRITDKVLKDLEQAVVFAPLHDPAGDRPDPRHDEAISPGPALCMLRHRLSPDHAGRGFDLRHTRRSIASRECAGMASMGFPVREWWTICGPHQTEPGQFPQRMVIAHLGSGCSVTALVDGRSVDTPWG